MLNRRGILAACLALAILAAVLARHRAAPAPSHDTGLSVRDAAPAPSTAASPTSFSPSVARGAYVPDEVLIRFAPGVTPERRRSAAAALGASIVKIVDADSGLVLLGLPKGSAVEQAVTTILAHSDVEAAEPNIIYHAEELPDDPDFDRMWGLHNVGQDGGIADVDINAPEAWADTTGGRDFVIGVIDTGVDYNHEDLVENIWRNPGEIPDNGVDDDQNGYVDDVHGIDTLNGDSDPLDDDGHGTHVAGTIAATGNNGIGASGVMWQASIVACKFLNTAGTGTLADAVTCLEYFADLHAAGIPVVATNNSWGALGSSQILNAAIAQHRTLGILFVASAGNDGLDTDQVAHYPSGYDLENIISVASHTRHGWLSDFSNYGAATVDIAAPGSEIYGPLPDNRWGIRNGTSMAAPHVTGVVGLIRSWEHDISAAEIRDFLFANAVPSSYVEGKVSTGGRLRATLPFLDRDGDGMPNRWEDSYGFDPDNAADATLDPDGDGLGNLDEYLNGTHPLQPDSDSDGLSDGQEVNDIGSDPTLTDTDADGLDDNEEVNQYGTDPIDADTDDDGLSDGDEVERYTTDPFDADSDDDGLSDGWEADFDFDPLAGGEQSLDTDNDGLTNADEFALGTNPRVIDTDEDALTDGDEIDAYATDPANRDTDGDAMHDGWEVRYGLDPTTADGLSDTDSDGYTNAEEYEGGSNPTDPQSIPATSRWTNVQGSARHTGYVPVATEASEFRLRWQKLLPTFDDNDFVGIDPKRLYIAIPQVGGGQEAMALSLADGAVEWARPFADFGGIGPVRLGTSHIVVNDSRSNFLSSLRVLDDTDGSLLRSLNYDYSSNGSQLVTAGDDAYISGLKLSTNSYSLFRFDVEPGEVTWQTELTGDARTYSIPLAVNDTTVAIANDDELHLFDVDSGDLRAVLSDGGCDEVFERTLILTGANAAFVVGSRCLTRYDIETESIVWQVEGDFAHAPAAADDSAIYVVGFNQLLAISQDTGETLWTWDAEMIISNNVVVSRDHVFLSAFYDVTVAIDKATHTMAWSHPASGRLALSDTGSLIIGSRENGITVIDVSGDSDGDGIPDFWERHHKLNDVDPGDAAGDSDNDGIDNLDEYLGGTNPASRDTDGDGLSDSDELDVFGTSPTNPDTDGDGLLDGQEIQTTGTNPFWFDTDRDGVGDGDETGQYQTDPNDPDSSPSLLREYSESFEAGMPADWVQPPGSDTAGWSVVSNVASDGQFSLRTDPDDGSRTAKVEWRRHFAAGDLSLDFRLMPESSITGVDFLVDGIEKASLRAGDWRRFRHALSAGSHKLRWVYHYRFGEASHAWIDNVTYGVPAPVASDTRNVLMLKDEKLREFGPDGVEVRAPIEIPDVRTPRDLAVAADHRIVIVDEATLHFYDPVSRRFTRKYLPQGFVSDIAAGRQSLYLANGTMPDGGILVADLQGNLIDHVLTGRQFFDVSVGLDGYLYALQGHENLVVRIDQESHAIAGTIPVGADSLAIAVDVDGSVFVSTITEQIEKFDGVGNLIGSVENPLGRASDDLSITTGGLLVFGSRNGGLGSLGTDLSDPTDYPIDDGPSGLDSRVTAVPRTGIDSDADGLPDWWEHNEGLDFRNATDAGDDTDGDGLTNFDEFGAGTAPLEPDTDGDGLGDGDEVLVHSTDPLHADSDRDGLTDYAEVLNHGTDPLSGDSDGDGLDDYREVVELGSNPLSSDTDADGMPDLWEVESGLDLTDASDASLDPDSDGLTNGDEYANATDISDADTDDDDLLDGEEVHTHFTDPLSRDSDDDLMSDGWEIAFGLDALMPAPTGLDTDGDGFSDVTEFYDGSSPVASVSIPAAGPWTMHRGDSRHAGYVPILLQPARYAEAWRTDIFPGSDMPLESPASVNGDRLWVTARDDNGVHVLTALAGDSGDILWGVEIGDVFEASAPTYTENRVFVQTTDNNVGRMLGVDATTGAEVVNTPFETQIRPLYAPTAFGGRLYGTHGRFGGIASFDVHSSVIDWFRDIGVRGNFAAAVDGEFVYVYADGGLSVLDRSSGADRFTIDDPTNSTGGSGSVTLDGFGLAIHDNSGDIVAFDTRDRRVTWAANSGEFRTVDVSFAAGDVLTVTGGNVVALDVRDGSQQATLAAPQDLVGPVIATATHIIAASYEHTYAINRSTGIVEWSAPVAGALSMGSDGHLYVAGYDGDLVAFALRSDRDGDGMDDDWEVSVGLDPDDPADAALDADGDGLSNVDEYGIGLDPNSSDSDGDTLSDFDELNVHATDPREADTDGDGLSDGVELLSSLTDPTNADTDGDGLSDGDEVVTYSTDPDSQDTDNDGYSDSVEVRTGSDPLDTDSLPQPLGATVESFENGSLPDGFYVPLDAEFGWRVTTGDASDGSHRVESDALLYPSTAVLEFTGYFSAGFVQFDARKSGGPCCSDYNFYVDGVRNYSSTSQSWWQHFVAVDEGIHTLRWELARTGLTVGGMSTAFLDRIETIPDRDFDRMPDEWELSMGLDPDDASDALEDPDGDILNNRTEYVEGTLPFSADTDSDGMDDGYEVQTGLDPNDAADAAGDLDGDGLLNLIEYQLGTSANLPDSDFDGLPDGFEVDQGFDPLDPQDGSDDPDQDGLSNAYEYELGTSLSDADSDADGLPDGWEVDYGLDPLGAGDAGDDTDGDGLDNLAEFAAGTSPVSSDSDGDGMADAWELQYSLDPLSGSDAMLDPDGDTLTNLEEFGIGSSPLADDTDGDGMPDGWEVDNGLNALIDDSAGDPDGDGDSNLDEYLAGTDPQSAPPQPPPPPPTPPPSSGGGGGGAFSPITGVMLFLVFYLLRVGTGRRRACNRSPGLSGRSGL